MLFFSATGQSTKSINLNDELIVLAELLMSVITGPFTVIVIIITSHPLLFTINQSKFRVSNQMEVAISVEKARMNQCIRIIKLLCLTSYFQYLFQESVI